MSMGAYPLVADWIGTQGDRLIVHTGKVDIGQRISTALIQIAHEELTVPLEQIDIAPVRTGHAPDEGITSGSNSIEQSGHALRCAAATLRRHCIAAAIVQFGGTPKDWRLSDGILALNDSNHRISVLLLISDLPPDTVIDPDAEFAIRDASTPPKLAMRGLADMVRGSFVYVHDLDVPGLLHARIVHPPHARAKLRKVDEKILRTLQAKGTHIIRDGSFLAVAGSTEWPVVKAAIQIAGACHWDQDGGLPEMDIFTHLAADNAARFPVIDGTPRNEPVPPPLGDPDLAARYERPYQMHAALAPSAALAEWNGQTLTIFCHSQGIYPLRTSIADSLGLKQEQIDITHVPGSGCYGHNGADDAAFEAALIAMALKSTPILLKWTRQDEHCWEPYASAMAVELAAQLKDGLITAISAEAFSDTHRGRPRAGPNRAGPSKLLANRFGADPIGPNPAEPNFGRHAGMHRNLEPVYDFPKKRLVKNLVSGLPHRTSAMRTLGAAANIFALESFVDELAHSLNADPLALRRAHLADRRALDVLDELALKIADLPPLPDNCGRGIAYAQYKNQMARVAVCVEIDSNDRAEIQLTQAFIVADAGRVVDAEGLAAQLEGGFVQAASWALYEEVTWDRSGILSSDWDSYPVIRFDNIPIIDVTILDRPDAPSTGVGEASPGPAVAAIANAVFDATGVRMRRLPMTPAAILRTATIDDSAGAWV